MSKFLESSSCNGYVCYKEVYREWTDEIVEYKKTCAKSTLTRQSVASIMPTTAWRVTLPKYYNNTLGEPPGIGKHYVGI